MILHVAALAWAIDDGSCSSWLGAEELGAVARVGLDEISGLAASHAWPGVLWALEDAGGSAVLYALGTDGEDLGSLSLLGAENTDWEDLALGPCLDEEACSCLYVGDVGDNEGTREAAVVWRVPEPSLESGRASGQSAPAEGLWFRYPDGPRDAESIAVDPTSGRLYVLSKEAGATGVYAFPAAPAVGGKGEDPVTLELVAELRPGTWGAGDDKLTAADVSPRGLRWALRSDEDLFVLEAPQGGDLEEALGEEPSVLPAPGGPAGEAVAWDPEGVSLYLVGEGAAAVVGVSCASFEGSGEAAVDPLVWCGASGEAPVEPGCDGCGGARFVSWGWLIAIGLARTRRLDARAFAR